MKRLPAGCVWWRWNPRATTSSWSKRPQAAIKNVEYAHGARTLSLNCQVTNDDDEAPAPGLCGTSLGATIHQTYSMCSTNWSKPSQAPWRPNKGGCQGGPEAQERLAQVQTTSRSRGCASQARPRSPPTSKPQRSSSNIRAAAHQNLSA